MAWAGGVWDGTYGISTDSIGMGMQVFYDKKFLSTLKDELYMWQFAQKRPIPANGGKQIRFFRYFDIANVTAKLTEGTNPVPTAVTGHEINRTLEEWGAFSQVASLVSRTHIDSGLSTLSALWGTQAGRSIDLRTLKEVITNGSYAIRSDNAVSGAGMAPGCWAGTVGSTACTTILIYSADTTATNDFWIGGQITFTSGKNYGQSRYISDNVATTTNSLSVVLPFENIPAAGDTFIISHPGKSGATYVTDVLDATDIITYKTLVKTWEALKTQKTQPYAGGYYILMLGPTTHAGFLSDGTWIPVQQYAGGGGLLNGEIGRFMNFRIVTTTQPFRCVLPTTATTGGPGQTDTTYQTAGVNYSATGAGHYSPAFGQEAFGVTNLPGFSSPKIIVKTPGPNDTSNPLNRFSTVGWEMPFVPCALNALWCVSIVSGG